MERSTALLIQGTVQPAPLPRAKSCVQPIFSHPVQFQTCEDRQSTNQKAEIPKEAGDTEPSSPILQSPNSVQPSCPQSLVSPPSLPPRRGVNSGASEKKHMAIYPETLPTTATLRSNVARSASLLERKCELAAPVLRTYSDPEPLRRKTASQIPKEAGDTEPISPILQSPNSAQLSCPRSLVSPPSLPPRRGVNSGASEKKHMAIYPETLPTTATLLSNVARSASLLERKCELAAPVVRTYSDPEPLRRKTASQIPKEAGDTEPSSPILQSPNSAQLSCPQSLVSPPSLPPRRGVNSGASEKKHIAIYPETLPTTATLLSNVARSASLLELKHELAAPVLRTYSDPEPLRRKTASQLLLNTCNRYLRPERPPPPNFNKSHGLHRLPLLRQASTSDNSNSQEEVSATSPGASERQSEDQRKMVEEVAVQKPSSPSCSSLSPTEPSSPQSPVSHPHVPLRAGPHCSATEEGEIPLYVEILPDKKTKTEFSNLERSTSLVTLEAKPPVPGHHRSKSHSELLFRKPAWLRILRDQQKASQGAKKPPETSSVCQRPERPPPPNFNRTRERHNPPLRRQISTADDCGLQDGVGENALGANDLQDGESETSLKTFEVEDAEKLSSTLLLQSPSSTEQSCSQSPVATPPLPPPAGPLNSASDGGEIPLYVEILPDKTAYTEFSNLERSTSLVTLEAKPPVPGHHRSKSHSELLFRKPAWLRILRDQQKASQGAKKPPETSSVCQRPERPPPPNFNRTRERYKHPLRRQISTADDCGLQDGVGENALGASDSQDGESETSLKTFEVEDIEKLSSTLLLQSPSSTEPSGSQSPVATPPLPPPAGPLNSASDGGEIPLYVEILPDKTADTEVSNLGRSTSLVLPKPVSPVAVQRSKSHSEILRKPAWLRIPRDPKKANPGPKKPLDTSNQCPRPDRPPPPNLNKSHGGHRPQIPIQVCTVGPSDGSGPRDRVNDSPPGACDSQDGESNTSLKIFEEEDVNKPSSPLPLSPVSPQPSSRHSLETGPDLHPLSESESFVSGQGEVPIYEEIMLDETISNEIPIYLEVLPGARTAATEVSISHRSTTFFTPKPEPPAPMNRSQSHTDRIFRKPVWFRHSRDQQKSKKGAKVQKLSDAGSRRPRPERPPPPNFTKSRTEHRPPLPIRKPNNGSSEDPLSKCEDSKTASHSRSTEVNNETRQFDCDNVYDSKDPRGARDTEYDSKPPPLGCDARREDGELPLGGNGSKFDSKTLPVDCNTIYDSKFPPVAEDTQYKGSDTSPCALDTKYSRTSPLEVSGTKYAGTPPAAVCDTQSKDIKTSLYTCDTIYDSISAPATCNTMYDSKPPPVGGDTENNNKPPSVHCDLENNTNTPPVGCDSEDHSKSPPVDCGSDNNSNTSSDGCDSEDNRELLRDGGDSEDNGEPPPPGCDYEDNSEPPPPGCDSEDNCEPHPTGCDSEDNSEPPPTGCDSEDNRESPPVGCDSKDNSKLFPGHYDSEDNSGLLPVGCDSENNSKPAPPGSESDNNSKPTLTDRDPEYDGKPPPVGRDAAYDGISLPASYDPQHKKNLKIYEELPGTPSHSGLSFCQMPGPYSTGSVPPVPPRVDVAYSLAGQGQVPAEPRMEPRETTAAEARMSKVVHKFFTKRPLPPIPQPGTFEEQGTCSHITHDYSAEPKPEDIELLMAWWHTVEQQGNMPLDLDLTEEEEMREFRLMAYRIKMGLRLFSCLLRKNVDSLQGHITQLSATADSLDKKRKKAKIAAMTGGTTGAVGGVAVVAGLVLAPVTFGASLVATAVGVGVATAGGLTRASATLTSKVNNNLDRKRVQKIMRDYEKDISDIERCLKFVNMGIGWVGQQNASRLRVADQETAAVARLAEVTHGNSSSIHTACQSVEILQEFSQAMDNFFDNAEVQKGTEVKFADEIHGLAEELQQRLNSLMRIHDILTSAAITAGVYKEPHSLP